MANSDIYIIWLFQQKESLKEKFTVVANKIDEIAEMYSLEDEYIKYKYDTFREELENGWGGIDHELSKLPEDSTPEDIRKAIISCLDKFASLEARILSLIKHEVSLCIHKAYEEERKIITRCCSVNVFKNAQNAYIEIQGLKSDFATSSVSEEVKPIIITNNGGVKDLVNYMEDKAGMLQNARSQITPISAREKINIIIGSMIALFAFLGLLLGSSGLGEMLSGLLE